MNTEDKILRIGTVAILCAVCLRILSGSSFGTAAGAISDMDIVSAAIFLQTGRLVRQSDLQVLPPVEEETVPDPTEAESIPVSMAFSQDDAALIHINDYAGKDPDIVPLLLQPLSWDLTGDEPTVLILHTHATESYENAEGYTESSQYRTLNEAYNMISIGEAIAEILTQQGISVLHDRSLHDHPSYNGSYDNAQVSIEQYLQAYPSIRLVLDIHRDAMVDGSGNQIGYTVETPKGEAAKVMLVVGSNHDRWQENMALAVKLQACLEKSCPGICRPISLRSSGFNQRLSPGSILIEMGAAGNTRQEALLAAEYVARAVLALSNGTG